MTNEFIKTNKKQEHRKPNFISRLFMCWIYPVIIKGNLKNLEEEDLIMPDKKFSSEVLGERLERYWLQEYENATRENRKPSLWKAMRRAFWLSYMYGAFHVAVSASVSVVQPMLFADLLAFWAVDSTMTRQEAALYALAMIGLNFIRIMCHHHHTLFVSCFAMKIKVACSALLYRKVLRMSQQCIAEVAGGKLINILSNDMIRFDYAFMFLHNFWVVPIQMSIILYFLYISAGYESFVGLFSVVLLILPVQGGLTKLLSIKRRETAQRSDTRIKLMTEILNSIQVIKMYAWEKPFQLVVEAARNCEMRSLWKSIVLRSTFIGFMLFTERTMLFVTILTLALTGNLITATLIYPIQQYYSIIQMNVIIILPVALANFSEMLVSLERMQQLLTLDEKEDLNNQVFIKGISNKIMFNSKEVIEDPDCIITAKYIQIDIGPPSLLSVETKPTDVVSKSEYSIELKNMSASWNKSNDNADRTLKNISLRLKKGKLCAIIGPVGAGKSAFLHTIIKELPICDGNININGRISYATQDSWFFPATVRENIIFGLPYDVQKYKEVCRVCSLLSDFKQFPYGDLSLVGERGVSLSGGQRARINLARSIYRDADIYLLDDPISAVDTNVGRQLFERCIKGYLSGRTRILVTHQIHYLKVADFIIVLNGGAVENMGTYDEMVKSGKEFSTLLCNQESENFNKELEIKTPSIHRTISNTSSRSLGNPEDECMQAQEVEERTTGSMKWEVLRKYLTSVKPFYLVVFTLLTAVITQVAATTVDYWLSYWINQVNHYKQSLGDRKEPDINLDETVGKLSTRQYLLVYGCVILSLIIISHLRIICFVTMAMKAAQTLHNAIYKKISVAAMRFFDTNPSGRVLNRFSKDMGAIDELLPRSMLETMQMCLSIVSILTLNAIALPLTLVPTFILVIILVFFLKYYLNAAHSVKRLEGTTKSPVFGMVNSTISGISTIRSSNSEQMLLKMFDSAQNLHSSAYYTFVGGSAAFALHLDALCLIYLGTILSIFILLDFSALIPVGSVGLAVSQSMVLTIMLQMAARYTADFLGQMTAVERVLEYTKLPTEENINDKTAQVTGKWPLNGTIVFDNVLMKYGPKDSPVLRNLNFEIKNGWKVGVVGRTGAGKSSLISALFRLYDIEGNIKIDGIDINVIDKKILRSKISIIPQEPVLFSATVRYNLDPFDHYNDEEIWRALEQVELRDVIPSLDYKVSAGGSNFSMGQRQLVCLARAILRSNKILIMDEATANVDPQTDALIQKTIRREFETCTVITIAHRLNTIMDSDRVLVMDKGVAKEFDHPQLLLSNPNSIFSFMVKETGESMSKILFEMVKTGNVHEFM